jgi:hypothetical protein
MLNEDVIDLYGRVTVGTKVVVLPDTHRRAPADVAMTPRRERVMTAAPVVQSTMRAEEPAYFMPRPLASVPVYRGASPYSGAAASRLY